MSPTPLHHDPGTTPLGDTPEHSDAERVAQPDRRFERPRESHSLR